MTSEPKSITDVVETCVTKGIHKDIIRTVKRNMPDQVAIYEVADLFKLFGDSTRLGILWALSESEMCVCDLAAFVGVSESAVSHQLRRLRDLALVKHRRDGQTLYYSLDDEHVFDLIKIGIEHLLED